MMTRHVVPLLLCASSLLATSAVASPIDPRALASLAVNGYLSLAPNSSMLAVETYGPAIALAAAYDIAAAFDEPAFAASADKLLAAYASTPGSVAYNVLNNVTVPWGASIGDQLGLMPLSYVARAQYHGEPFPSGDNWALALSVADRYVLGWPLRLPDGTISRNVGWANESNVNGSFLWSDDQFMGTALLARLLLVAALPAPRAAAYADFVAAQQVSFAAHMQDAASGLFFHGFNGASGDESCCFWGRANGWVMMAHADVVRALALRAPEHPLLPEIVAIWRRQAAGLLAAAPAFNASDGRWHQVVNDSSTFLETSVTSMALYSIAEGVRGGYLDGALYAPLMQQALAGIASQIVPVSGVVGGICEGTGIGTNAAFYEARGTAYNTSDPGLGSVFRALLAVDSLVRETGATALLQGLEGDEQQQ